MSNNPIVSRISLLGTGFSGFSGRKPHPGLHHLHWHPRLLPKAVSSSPEVRRCLQLLGPLDWEQFPERDLQRNWGQSTTPYAAFAAACLYKIDRQIRSMAQLRKRLVECPELAWLFGFLPPEAGINAFGETDNILPSYRHFTRMLRQMPNECLQFLLTSSVQALIAELAQHDVTVGEVVSLDTKHVLAWVKENNPKAYIKGRRYDKTQQPNGDPDCKLGCKRRHNQRASSKEPPPTPDCDPLPANTISVGEFYWGYASGVVAVKVPGYGEFVLAELTQPFDQPDVSYFLPLMAMVERRLGRKPRFGALDAAFDAWYVYEYFHDPDHDGFAAVPFVVRGGIKARKFTQDGNPYCAADLPMPLKYTFSSNSGLFEHLAQRYACPLLFPKPSGEACPVDHENFHKGGCTTTLPASVGSRLRYTLQRGSEAYKRIYRQRTAVERIFSQAVELGIERPRLRNGNAIANLNTLTYTLINLRLLRRIRQQN